LWTFGYDMSQAPAPASPAGAAALPQALSAARFEVHAQLKQANYDMSRHQFNTVASACMKILAALETAQKSGTEAALTHSVLREGFSILLRIISPITPHIAQALWRELAYGTDADGDILDAPWPEHDPAALI